MFIRVRVKDRIQQVFQGFRISYAFDKGVCCSFLHKTTTFYIPPQLFCLIYFKSKSA